MHSPVFAAVVVTFALAVPRLAHAQSDSATSFEPAAERLYRLRLAHLAEDEPQGYVLLTWGVSSVATGAVLGASGIGGENVRWYGVNTIVWGAINTAIAIPWVLSFPRERREAEAGRARSGEALVRLRSETTARSRRQSTVFGINALIDIAYVTGGAIAWWAGTQQDPGSLAGEFLLGTGVAAVTQGAFLLVFDAVGWLLAGRRTHRLEALEAAH
jgi:hypothetical protein